MSIGISAPYKTLLRSSVKGRELYVARAKFVIEGRQLLVGGLQFLLRRLELLGDRSQFLKL